MSVFDTYFAVSTPFATIIAIVAGLGAALAVFFVFYFLIRKPKSASRTEDDEFLDDPGLFGPLTPGLANVLPEGEQENKDFRRLLRQAGFYRPSARDSIYALRMFLLLMPLFLGMYMGALAPEKMFNYTLGGLFVGVALSIIPRLYIYYVRNARIARIRAGLADTIDMFGMCASGGMTTSESLEHVAEQLTEYPDLTQELRILRRQAEVGSLEQACADLVERVNIPEIRQFSYLILRGARLGNQMTQTLNEQADHIRAMRRHYALAQANKTPTKLVFPIMFCFAPAALILLLSPSLMEVYDFMISKESLGIANTAQSIGDVTPELGAPTE
ncbi:MAG: type II secretion system F family protein [Planctomycetia bacterium]|nr:type II secretion system F family protein [Planctomycetia bacterium]